jgi:polyisoprenoid-binding protein YceI
MVRQRAKYLLQRISPSRIQKNENQDALWASKEMKRRRPAMATATSTPATTTWNIDPAHSSAEFKVKHMMISNVKGSFSGLSGILTEHATDSTLSSVEASVPVATVSTGDAQRDGHLKSADFFDAEKYPTLDFKSTKVVRTGDAYEVTGDLTVHGVTKPVTFAVDGPSAPGKDPWGNTRIGLSATTKINRKDFGLVWNAALETGGFLVGEEIAITLDVEFIKAAQ